ncbi:MAG: TrbC/VirB2 family protein [Clostridia bacterium]|jgi:trbC/VIRB2 family
MKKTVKIISTLLLVVMLVTSIAGTVFADSTTDVLDKLKGDGKVETSSLTTVGNNVVTIINVVGIVIAVIILLIIGIKYMIGSASEKAEYKKTMIPYIVGAVLIFAGTSLVRVIYSLANSVSGK